MEAKDHVLHKLAQALRKGMAKTNEVHYKYLIFKKDGRFRGMGTLDDECHACAVGAAIIGSNAIKSKELNGENGNYLKYKLNKVFKGKHIICPIIDEPIYSKIHKHTHPLRPIALMEHLFEDHQLTREKVAELLEVEAFKEIEKELIPMPIINTKVKELT